MVSRPQEPSMNPGTRVQGHGRQMQGCSRGARGAVPVPPCSCPIWAASVGISPTALSSRDSVPSPAPHLLQGLLGSGPF